MMTCWYYRYLVYTALISGYMLHSDDGYEELMENGTITYVRLANLICIPKKTNTSQCGSSASY